MFKRIRNKNAINFREYIIYIHILDSQEQMVLVNGTLFSPHAGRIIDGDGGRKCDPTTEIHKFHIGIIFKN
ncbi:hypothetical protein DERF_005090 [Dermatophagoides farinae]|uniref:Uncharacterized protein n=1 Tax=Dermatophagoides farinae TaxID=6954 RepID=A0A922I7G4_DERFA|nr:hypothetical protein DERF_005090 [Dermatophagoides farinae]